MGDVGAKRLRGTNLRFVWWYWGRTFLTFSTVFACKALKCSQSCLTTRMSASKRRAQTLWKSSIDCMERGEGKGTGTWCGVQSQAPALGVVEVVVGVGEGRMRLPGQASPALVSANEIYNSSVAGGLGERLQCRLKNKKDIFYILLHGVGIWGCVV